MGKPIEKFGDLTSTDASVLHLDLVETRSVLRCSLFLHIHCLCMHMHIDDIVDVVRFSRLRCWICLCPCFGGFVFRYSLPRSLRKTMWKQFPPVRPVSVRIPCPSISHKFGYQGFKLKHSGRACCG